MVRFANLMLQTSALKQVDYLASKSFDKKNDGQEPIDARKLKQNGPGERFCKSFSPFSSLSTFATRTCHFCERVKAKRMKFSSPLPGLKSFTISDRTPLILSQRVVKFPFRGFSWDRLLCVDAK